MFAGSPKRVALGQIVLAVILSILSGMFIIQGLGGALQGEISSWMQLVLAPVLLSTAILLARSVWKAIP
jgi:hypothetical protein